MLRRFLICFCALIVLTGCQVLDRDAQNDDTSGRIILWHSWSDQESAVLEAMLAEFNEIHPHIEVIDIFFPPEELQSNFRISGSEGAGPDLLIGSDSWIQSLAQGGLIKPYTENSNAFYPLAREAVRLQGELIGLPMSLEPYALYYNKSLVDTLPATLDDLLVQAADGNSVAFVPRFEEAYWGIQAFGPDLFDDDGRLNLMDSGLNPWLEWLSEAQNEPGVILNVDKASLRQLFIQGDVAYFVAGPEEQTILQMQMEDPFGVTVLPSGPEGPAGPLLPVETLLFYEYSSPNQAKLANILAEFLTNQQQSIRIMRDLDKAPANQQISVDARLYPTASGFIRQSKTAVVIPNEWSQSNLKSAGDRLYAAVLSGELSSEEALCQFVEALIVDSGQQNILATLPPNCSLQE